MATKPVLWGFIGSCLLIGTSLVPARAAEPTIEQILSFRPRQKEVVYATPAPEEIKFCTVEKVKNAKGQIYGWLLLDSQKKTLRRFLDLNGDNNVDVWSYYKDGAEVYRETDTGFTGRINQFRWFNSGGMKWGVDAAGQGAITAWRLISAEEVGHELFLALQTGNLARLQALLISDNEIALLKLPSAKAEQIKESRSKIAGRFQKLAADPKIQSGTFLRVESATPHCVPADSLGIENDVLHFPGRSILYEYSEGKEKKVDFFHTGELIQVGLAWRLVDLESNVAGPATPDLDPALRDLFSALEKLDRDHPQLTAPRSAQELKVLTDRVALLEKIAGLVKNPVERDNWLRQVIDSLYAAAQVPEGQAALARLTQYKDQLAKAMPDSPLVPLAHYRQISAYYLPKLNDANPQKAQEEWLQALSKFVQSHPKADDTAEALHYLGMGSEFAGKDQEAVRWYTQIYTNFPTHFLAGKAEGAKRRLESVGKKMELAGPQLTGGNFDIGSLKDHVVIVYYWATYCGDTCTKELAQLRKIANDNAGKKVALVCVNLDDKAEKAVQFLQATGGAGIHLFQLARDGTGGLNSPYAVHYGINGLPSMFLVDRNGNVLRHSLQITELEEALKKAL